MGKYTVTTGQNMYDVALHLTGSIEGVIDLMMCNPELDMERTLKSGDTLLYTDGFVIDPDTVAAYRSRGVVPAGGERTVYPKVFDGELFAEMRLAAPQVSASIEVAGSGTFQVDWGDNSAPETLALSGQQRRISHRFDSVISTPRRLRLYGQCRFTDLDLSGLRAESVVMLRGLEVERFTMHTGTAALDFVQLLRGAYRMDLSGITAPSLLPVAECRELMSCNLSGVDVRVSAMDEYLIALVKRHYGRRSCTVTLSQAPSGEYREPARDAGLNYVITSGMEAVWLLTHEKSWNEAGAWTIIAGEKTYTYEPENGEHSGGSTT